jgi:hypothetical protein
MGELPVGPYRRVSLPGGGTAPWYIAPFDKDGLPTGPRTISALVDDAAAGNYSDIFIFSHGWNNGWAQASRRYDDFIKGYAQLRETYGLDDKPDYNPLLVGIFWPSISLLLPWEHGPKFAADPLDAQDEQVEFERRGVDEIAAEVPAESRGRFYELVQRESLEETEADELAEILADQYQGAEDELSEPSSAPDIATLRGAWAALGSETSGESEPEGDDWGTVDSSSSRRLGAAAGIRLDPRDIVRATTVWKMKDRAGRVGSTGVASLLSDIHAGAERADIHLIGHSYGCRVLLAAVTSERVHSSPDSPPIDSVLLLQPAVNFYCFAEQVPHTGKAGGYRAALAKIRQPILSTFSQRDRALHDEFHLAVRRKADLGEQPQLAALGEAPSIYCALGGYGPAGMGALAEEMHIKEPKDEYTLSPDARVVALRADDEIRAHGDISNKYTYWALYNQVGQ